MTSYVVGTRVFMDWIFSGKPLGRVTRVIEPGQGNSGGRGRIEVRLDNGTTVEGDAFTVVPVKQILPLRKGQFFTRVDTGYRFVQ